MSLPPIGCIVYKRPEAESCRFFIHYKTFEEAKTKWDERKQRINYDNLFIIGTDKDNFTYETLKAFENLPYENKIIFTHIDYSEISSSYCIKGFEDKNELGVITNFKKGFLMRRYLDDFDYIINIIISK